MFGSSDNNQQQPEPHDGSGIMQASMPDPINGPISPSASAVNSVYGSATSGAPEMPASPAPQPIESTPEPVASDPTPPSTSSNDDDNSTAVTADDSGQSDDLIDLKQQALQQLSPLVSHLEQTPEEKFRTTMMMIQASDDKTLLISAYEAAQNISDDKAKAQALLDVINEINYFTQHSAGN